MGTGHRVFIQSAKPENLSEIQTRFLETLIVHLKNEGLQIISDRPNDSIKDRLETIRQSHGVIVLAFSQWKGQRTTRESGIQTFPSEFAHICAVMAVATSRPLLVLRDKSVGERGVLRSGYLNRPIISLGELRPGWLDTPDFTDTFKAWVKRVKRHRRADPAPT